MDTSNRPRHLQSHGLDLGVILTLTLTPNPNPRHLQSHGFDLGVGSDLRLDLRLGLEFDLG